MKSFYAVLDCQSFSECPPSLQHLAIRSFCEQHNGEVSFYTCEDPLSLPYGVLEDQLPEIETDGLCFFTTRQCIQEGFDFPFLERLLPRWSVGFARENVWVTKENYKEVRPWLWREGHRE